MFNFDEYRSYETDPKLPPELIITVGLPASGKSTWAKKLVASLSKQGRPMTRVNRDDLRAMCFDSHWTREREKFIIDVEIDHVKRALTMGYSIVVDDTNLSEKTREMWNTFSKQHLGVPAAVEGFLNTPYQICIERDKKRTPNVGRNVIERMAMQYKLIPPKVTPDGPTFKCVLFDIDGTLADCEWRKMFVKKSPKDWHGFFVNTVGDEPRPEIVELCRQYFKTHRVIVVSGRPAAHTENGHTVDVCKETQWWLDKFEIPYDNFIMRNANDRRPDYVVKAEILNQYLIPCFGKENIDLVVDDRPSVVQMWKDNGLNVMDVGNGLEF